MKDECPEDIKNEIRKLHIAEGDELAPEKFPFLDNMSAAFVYQFIPRPIERKPFEYVYVPMKARLQRRNESDTRRFLAVSQWNMAWEAGQLRHDMLDPDLAEELPWLSNYKGQNIYLLPSVGHHRYDAFIALFHLLPRRTLERFGLPLLKRGIWPSMAPGFLHEDLLPINFDQRLSDAFAYHIWPLMVSGSSQQAFSDLEPLRLLTHNLDFWLPYIHEVAEERLRSLPIVTFENPKQARLLRTIRRQIPLNVEVGRPRCGGTIWCGEEEAWEATHEMIKRADAGGKLRAIIEAIRSNRVEEDFSPLWSFAREDFERKLYHKRLKVKVSFVELNGTIPVHGPESEIHENLLWEDFMAIVEPKDRHVVVLLRNGETKIGEIGKLLGYSNHSPISKALTRIRKKAADLLDIN
jgi:hypothetical protein